MNWEIKICAEPIDLPTVSRMAEETFGDYVKGVVDVEKKYWDWAENSIRT